MMPIPFQGEPIKSFGEGFDRGLNMYNAIMNARMESARQKLAEQNQARLKELAPSEMLYKFYKGLEAKANADLYSRLIGSNDLGNQSTNYSPNDLASIIPSHDDTGRQPLQVQLPPSPHSGASIPYNEMPFYPEEKQPTFVPSESTKINFRPDEILGSKIEVLNPGDPNLYFLDKLAGKVKNIAPPIVTNQDGYQVIRHPSGKVERLKIGPSAEESARNKGFSEYAVKTYGEANDAAMNYQAQQANFDEIVDTLEQFPNPEQVIGPINRSLTQIFGSPQELEFLGNIMASTGNVVLEAAKNIKGAFTGRDQTLINSMKPNANDRFEVFLGKLKTLSELNSLAEKRMSIYSSLVKNGLDPNEAMKLAQQKTKFEGIGDKYKETVKFNQYRSMHNKGEIPEFSNEQEAKNFYQRMGGMKNGL